MNHPASLNVPTILKHAAGRAAQWRPLLLLILLSWLPAALVALPLWSLLSDTLDNSLHAAEWARHLDVIMFADTLTLLGVNGSTLAGAGLSAGLVALLLLPFQNAILVSAARTDERLGLGDLLCGGLREYWPMLRLMLVSLIPLGVAGGLIALASKGVGKYAQHAILLSDVENARWLLDALALVLLSFALAGIDAGRARFAYDPRKRSAIKAWWRGLKLVVTQPLRSAGIFLGIVIPALVVLAVLVLVRIEISTVGALGFAGGFLIVQLISAVLGWAHLARLSGYFELIRALQERAAAPLKPAAA